MPDEATTTTTEETVSETTAATTPDAPETTEAPGTTFVTAEDGAAAESDAGQKEGEAASSEAAVVPEAYEMPEAPDGLEWNTKFVENLTPALKEAGITQEQFNRLAPAVLEQQVRDAHAAEQAYHNQLADWRKQIESHPRLGGSPEKLKETATNCMAAIRRFGVENELSDRMVQMLEQTGMGNHPVLAEFLDTVARSTSDDTFVSTMSGRAPSASERQSYSLAEEYPEMAKQIKDGLT